MYLHLIDIFPVLIGDLLWRGEIDMIFSCHFPCWREEGRMKILNRQGIPQTNHVMDTIGVTVYKFALGLFGLQIDFTGLLQRIDYCGPSKGCMQPLFSTGFSPFCVLKLLNCFSIMICQNMFSE